MTRIALLLLFILSAPLAADLDVKAELKDPRVSERRVYLRHEFTTGGDLIRCEGYLPKGEVPTEQVWELLFENAEVLRSTMAIAKHNANGTKIMIRGREVITLRGRGLLVESIRSNW